MYAHEFLTPALAKALPSQQSSLGLTPEAFDPNKTLDCNAGKATTRVDAIYSPSRIAQDPHDYSKRENGTTGHAQRQKTFACMPQSRNLFDSFSPAGDESTSRSPAIGVSRESKLP